MFACSSVNIACEIHYTCIIKLSTTLTVPAHIWWHPEQRKVIKLTRNIKPCGEEAPLCRIVPWRSIKWWRLRRPQRRKQQQQQEQEPPSVKTLLTHLSPDTTLIFAVFIGILSLYRRTSGMETFIPALTPSPTVQRIIRNFLSWFNNNTHVCERVGSLYGTSLQKEVRFTSGKSRNKNSLLYQQWNQLLCIHTHILSLIIL